MDLEGNNDEIFVWNFFVSEVCAMILEEVVGK